jgi:site-specific DNA recombinase
LDVKGPEQPATDSQKVSSSPFADHSLADFAKLVELFEAHGVAFVAVTQQFNTTTSMGRLTLNVVLSFAQFERELAGERIRDNFAASRRKGMWMGGSIPLGYDVKNRKL